jgi:hypothetical protein
MRGEIINEYQRLNSKDQKAFRRFLWANTVVGAILLTGLIVLASFPGGDHARTSAPILSVESGAHSHDHTDGCTGIRDLGAGPHRMSWVTPYAGLSKKQRLTELCSKTDA